MRRITSMKLFNIFLVLSLVFSNFSGVVSTVVSADENVVQAGDLIFSEYIEGSSYNKAIEIYNGTSQDIDLMGYSLVGFINGADQAGNGTASELPLSGIVKAGDVFVIAHSTANDAIKAIADVTGNAAVLQFNGDDALVLFKNYDASTRQGTIIDSIGQVGADPGSYWGQDVKTQDASLVRNPAIVSGDTNVNDDYDPSAEWIAFPKDTYDYLGSFHADVEPPAPEVPQEEYTVTVTSVVDGDTIHFEPAVMGGTTVRYLNIDTPETYHLGDYDINLVNTNPDHAQKYHGELAKEHLKTLLQPGDEVVLKVGEEITDAYGRILAQVIRKSDGLNTNLEMVKQGYASTYFIWPIGEEATYLEFQSAAKYAYDNNLGIWSDNNTDVLEFPFEFRAREQGKGLLRYVGNYETKQYVQPQDFSLVPVDKRVFFSEEQAIANEYTPAFEREANIADARYAPVGSVVTVEGVVTQIDGSNYYIQDETAAIVVRSYNLDAQVGDKISASGKTSEYYGLLQVVTSDVKVVEAGVGEPGPAYIKAADFVEKNEAKFVAVEEVTIISAEKYDEYIASDALGKTFVIYSEDTALNVGQKYDTLTGVIQYAFSDYRLFIRDVVEDIPVITIDEARKVALDTKVQIEGVVTAIDGKNYFVQDETAGIVVRVEEKGFTANVGDKIRAKARTEEYFELLQIIPTLQNVKVVEEAVGVPAPKEINSTELGEELEGQLVSLKYVTVNAVDGFGEYSAEDAQGSFVIDNTKFVEVGTTYKSLVGVLTYTYGQYKLLPRFADDATKLQFVSEDLSGETAANAKAKLLDAAPHLGIMTVSEMLKMELTDKVITKGNTSQHISSTLKHIVKSLEKIEQNKGNSSVEKEKIEHELNKLFKKAK
ncbi:endonuclease YncB(thermonuclease family)/uncharacterized protein YdeI (BOF family)/ribosomal silencing factor RsfS [Salirhabdus euzebyi]|uniref:Endonuclease YncB(Thermonuclease family)/uncharacterized protein YdeI (BOF family)/ribosomal silencing factor RsfS n=1 Tax=Salirhabdus euzebyi TaxID=394506 RepID=A0A841QA33_9BACI|nr:thermonuclease family protein [Salirhabdus euzebyi]MBB6455097.1 endonuclease YncB(thermonuclease family)/uncharacterized protein YdeI (BOF family)/ribosomal silencing factor RsfS [Salirhabdus euzebyi]